MPSSEFKEPGSPWERRVVFQTTPWSAVLAAGEADSDLAQEAVATLCSAYWYPLYAYARRKGTGAEDAGDLIQGFLAQFLRKESFRSLDRGNGKFRAFLLASLKHFMAKQWREGQAMKRGGLVQIISLDRAAAEERWRREPAEGPPPDAVFDRGWACTMIEQVLERLAFDYKTRGKLNQFERLQPYLSGELRPGSHDRLAAELGMSKETMRVELHRLRRVFGRFLRAEVARTVSGPGEIADELRHLLAAWAGSGP